MSFPKSWIVDINGGQRGTVVADVSFRTGIHYWEVTVADFRTICLGVCEMPKNARLLNDKWLGEIGYAVSASTCSGGTAFLWSKEQLSTFTVKSFTSGQRVGLLLDMEERTLEYYLDGERLHRISPDQKASDSKEPAFSKLPPGPLYPACSNGFDKAFCRAVELTLELPLPAGYLALRAQRRAEQAKAAEAAAPAARPPGAPAAPAAPAAPGAGAAAAAAASATSAADVMKAPAPAPTAAAAMLGNPPQKK